MGERFHLGQFEPLVCGGVHAGSTTWTGTGGKVCGTVTGASVTTGAACAVAWSGIDVVVTGMAGAGFDGATSGDEGNDWRASVWIPPGGEVAGSSGCCARAEIPYAEVRPNVALRAIPVERIRADRAGCRSRRTRLVVIVFTRLVVLVMIFITIAVMIIFALGLTANAWTWFVHH